MVNSGKPFNERVTLRSHYSRHEASQKPHSSSEHPVANNFFRRPPFRPTSTPIGASLFDILFNGILIGKHLSACRHAPFFSPVLKFTCRCVAARETLFGHAPPPAVSHPMTVSHSGRITVVTKPHRSHISHRNTLLPTTFSDDLHSGRRAHQ